MKDHKRTWEHRNQKDLTFETKELIPSIVPRRTQSRRVQHRTFRENYVIWLPSTSRMDKTKRREFLVTKGNGLCVTKLLVTIFTFKTMNTKQGKWVLFSIYLPDRSSLPTSFDYVFKFLNSYILIRSLKFFTVHRWSFLLYTVS